MPEAVAYLVSQYPALSHSFIEREILAVRAQGVDVHTFSIRPADPATLLTRTMRDEAEATFVVRGQRPQAWLSAGLSLTRRGPRAPLAGIRRAATSGRREVRTKVWQGFYLAEAVLLYEELRRRGIRHVHAHFANVAADVARLVTHLGRTEDGPDSGWRWSFTMHGSAEFFDVAGHDLPAKVADADAVSCISDFCWGQLMRIVDPRHWPKLEIVRMSVDADHYSPGPERQESDRLRVLAVGRLSPEKGLPVLMDAVTDVVARGLHPNVRIVGEGPLRAALEAQIRAEGLAGQVTLMGPLGQDVLPEQYRWADVYVLPSFMEGLPVVLMEALATECPVIATPVGAVEELVVPEESGLMVRPGRPESLADALMAMHQDPQRRRNMGKAGRQAILAEFTTASTGPRMADFLRRVRPRRAPGAAAARPVPGTK